MTVQCYSLDAEPLVI